MAVFAVDGLSVTLGGQPVLRDVSFSLSAGELVLLLGRSGSGKSVLIKAAVGFLAAEKGCVRLGDVVLDPVRQALEVSAAVTLVHQSPALLDELDVLDNVALPWTWRTGGSAQKARVLARAALGRVGASSLWDAQGGALSAGERKLVALARALMVEPRALLLDEPTTGMDAVAARRVALATAAIARDGTTVLVVTHDVEPFRDVATRVCLLHDGVLGLDVPAASAWSAPPPALAQFLSASPDGPLADGAPA